MTSMVAPINIGIKYRGNWCNAKKKIAVKGGEFLKPSFSSSCNTNLFNNERRFSLLVTSSSQRSHGGLDTINESTLLANERFVENGIVYRQNFFVRDNEIGADNTISMKTLVSFLQETSINHMSNCGVSHSEFGATREMDLRKLIWVVLRIQVQVERHSEWRDEIEVETWLDVAGKNAMRRDWIIRDHSTKEIIAKATSTWTVINRETRRLSKIPDEVRQELIPFHLNRFAIAKEEIDNEKIEKLTDATVDGFRFAMTPGWNDIDLNQHVNNVTYIRWVSESVGREVLEDYTMTRMTIEFRRECTKSDLLESITSSNNIGDSKSNINGKPHDLKCIHLIRLQDNKAELVRARTEWHLKQKPQVM